jgi:ATP-dependent Zn protease
VQFSAEWRAIVNEHYTQAQEIIDKRINRTRRVANAVLKHRTVDGPEFRRLWDLGDEAEVETESKQ